MNHVAHHTLNGMKAYVGREQEARLQARYCPVPVPTPTPESVADAATVVAEEPKRKRQRVVLQRKEDRAFVEGCRKSLTEWMAGGHPDSEVVLPSCNAFLRRALHEEIDALELGDSYTRETRKGAQGEQLVLMILSAEAAAAKEEADKLANKAKFNKERGFRRIFNAMVASKLPVVGHNVM
jgi:hypothetical protein